MLPSLLPINSDETLVDQRRVTVYDLQGYTIYVGRNALSNEALINDHKKSHPKCIWLHAFGQKGPHVVLCLDSSANSGLPVDPMVLRCAASKALKFSNGQSKKVVYAPLEDVYKPQKGQPGIFRTWRTSTIEL